MQKNDIHSHWPSVQIIITNPISQPRSTWPTFIPATTLNRLGIAPQLGGNLSVTADESEIPCQYDRIVDDNSLSGLVFTTDYKPNQTRQFQISVMKKNQVFASPLKNQKTQAIDDELFNIGVLGTLSGKEKQCVFQPISQTARCRRETLAAGPVRTITRLTWSGFKTAQGTLDIQQDILYYPNQCWFENRVTVLRLTAKADNQNSRVDLAAGFPADPAGRLIAPNRKICWLADRGCKISPDAVQNTAVFFPRTELPESYNIDAIFSGEYQWLPDAGFDDRTRYFILTYRVGRPCSFFGLCQTTPADKPAQNQTDFCRQLDDLASCFAEPLQISPAEPATPADRLAAAFEHAKQKLRYLCGKDTANCWPSVTYHDEYRWITRHWVEGFLPGCLWKVSTLDSDPCWKDLARKYTDRLTAQLDRDDLHDLGLLFYPSMTLGHTLTGDDRYRSGALQAAENLTRRYNPVFDGFVAWGSVDALKISGWVIIDSIMNMDLLFWAAKESGDNRFYEMAEKHAQLVQKYHIRTDNSSAHVVAFDPATGRAVRNFQIQGFSHDSTWSRGQAWGVYGFASIAHWTGRSDFRETAEKMADYFLEHLQSDYVPYWDFQAPFQPNEVRDTSAASVFAGGLLKLALLQSDPARADHYKTIARKVILSLCDHYLTPPDDRFEGIVTQGSVLQGVDNRSMIYGDYYFLEALTELLKDKK